MLSHHTLCYEGVISKKRTGDEHSLCLEPLSLRNILTEKYRTLEALIISLVYDF